MLVAVTGASGILGQFLVRLLVNEGIGVVAISRSAARSLAGGQLERETAANIRWCHADMGDTDAMREALIGCQAVVHCAFSHVPGRYRGGEGDDPIAFWYRNLIGTLKLLELAREHNVKKTVFVSSRAVFGSRESKSERHSGVVVDDDAATCPDTHYGALKRATELLLPMYRDIGLCSIRPTGIYGLVEPETATKWWDDVKELDSDGETADLDVAKTEVHGDDVAAAVLLLLRMPPEVTIGRNFNCSDVLISRNEVRRIASQLRAGVAADSVETQRPEPPHPVVMACPGLKELGWRPGGIEKLIDTVREILLRQGQL